MKISSVKASYHTFYNQRPEAAWCLCWDAPHMWTQRRHRERSWNYLSFMV